MTLIMLLKVGDQPVDSLDRWASILLVALGAVTLFASGYAFAEERGRRQELPPDSGG